MPKGIAQGPELFQRCLAVDPPSTETLDSQSACGKQTEMATFSDGGLRQQPEFVFSPVADFKTPTAIGEL